MLALIIVLLLIIKGVDFILYMYRASERFRRSREWRTFNNDGRARSLDIIFFRVGAVGSQSSALPASCKRDLDREILIMKMILVT